MINMFSERLNRKEFIHRVISSVGIIGIVSFLLNRLQDPNLNKSVGLMVILVWLLIMIAGTLYFFSLITRRLHDLGYSGKWSLLVLISILMLPLVGLSEPKMTQIATILGVLTFNLVFLFVLILKKGDPKINKYGSPDEK